MEEKNIKQRYTVKDKCTQDLRQFTDRRRLSHDEVEAAFRNDPQFPPLLSFDQAARMSHFAPSTIKRLASEGFSVIVLEEASPSPSGETGS